jgi:hypothetical protein
MILARILYRPMFPSQWEVCLWWHNFNSLGLSFLTCKVRVTISALLGFHDELMRTFKQDRPMRNLVHSKVPWLVNRNCLTSPVISLLQVTETLSQTPSWANFPREGLLAPSFISIIMAARGKWAFFGTTEKLWWVSPWLKEELSHSVLDDIKWSCTASVARCCYYL